MFRSVITQGWGSVWPCSRSRRKRKTTRPRWRNEVNSCQF